MTLLSASRYLAFFSRPNFLMVLSLNGTALSAFWEWLVSLSEIF